MRPFSAIPRRSTTLILAARKKYSLGYQLLLLQRSSASRFMPNRFVFPGGVAEPTDFSPDWLEIIGDRGLSLPDSMTNSPFYSSYKNKVVGGLPPQIGFRISVIRETFEESGILLVKQLNERKHTTGSSVLPISADKLTEWRKKVHKDASLFLQFCREIQCVPDIWSLHEWVNWITPVNNNIRFNTIFYFAFLDEKPEASHDGKELINSLWIEPDESLQQFSKGKLFLAPPQFMEITRIAKFNNFDELKSIVKSIDGVNVIESVSVLSKNGDQLIGIHPADSKYEELKEKVYKHCENYRKAFKPEGYQSVPFLQLDEATEEILRSAAPNTCRFTRNMKTNQIKIESNIVMHDHNLPTISSSETFGSKL